MYSKNFSQYYDQLNQDNTSMINVIHEIVKANVPPEGHILELGCGTGTVMRTFGKIYQLSGLDNAEGMLSKAKKKVPHAQYYHADMTTFTIPKTFDAVLCVFDSINHITKLTDWNKVFFRVTKHLKPHGLFLFDINTMRRLETLSTLQPVIEKIDPRTLACIKIEKDTKNLFHVKFQIFENITGRKITYIEEVVYEATFEINLVKRNVEKYFKIVDMIDPIRKTVTNDSGRILFVCTLR
jgi:ubiquinone/menaquinone biosynthesis C-methylase UbiE